MRKQKKETKRTALIRLLANKEHTPSELHQALHISLPLIHRYLREFIQKGYVEKIGTAPKTTYRLTPNPSVASSLIEKHFVFIDPTGRMRYGINGFTVWAEQHLKKYSLYEKVIQYEQRIHAAEMLRKKHSVFSLDNKLETLTGEIGGRCFLKESVAVFPYALPDFGRTKQAIFLGIAKDGSERGRKFADQLIDEFIPIVSEYISRHSIDAVAFVPPSARRRVQIMKLLTDRFITDVPDMPVVTIEKKHSDVIIQQKHLSTALERAKNADATFVVPPTKERHERLLLIDDMVGSGATLNSIAQKVVEQDIAKEIYGIGMVSDEKGFVSVKRM